MCVYAPPQIILLTAQVLYLYEIQMEKHVRRRGLGRFLVTVLTLMAKKYEMEKVLCTVFQHNHDSMTFFKETCRLGVDDGGLTASSHS